MPRAPTGIAGLDQMTLGGVPTGRVTLVEGGPGAGKTVLALQSLAHGAMAGEPGIFVAFEESPRHILANLAGFDWAADARWQGRVAFLDAQPSPDLVQSGAFDLDGLLAVIGAQAAATGARRIVFDALDVALALLPDAAARRRELHRLYHWLPAHGLTTIITAKAARADTAAPDPEGLNFLQFLVDCSIVLRHDIIGGISQRSLRIAKYRGSAFSENAAPMVIGPGGVEVAFMAPARETFTPVSSERITTGVARLDAMLSGGYYRGASVLISGAPGTAKTTLSGAFAEAACRRGEPALFVSFDSLGQELVRNLRAVGIDLTPHCDAGLLRIHATRALSSSAETHMLRIQAMAQAQGTRCLVVDPLSALSQDGNAAYSHSIAERLIDWAKARGITILCTSLVDPASPETEGTPLQVSTIADTWLHLSYRSQAGERNRALTIIKSRGTGHSNQVRELLLSDHGVTLQDVYLADGEVLMGTLRWAREHAETQRAAEAAAQAERDRMRLEAEASEIESRIALLRRDLALKEAERAMLSGSIAARDAGTDRSRLELGRRRRADTGRTEPPHG